MGRIRRSQHFCRWLGLPLDQTPHYEGNASRRSMYTKQALHAASVASLPLSIDLSPDHLPACWPTRSHRIISDTKTALNEPASVLTEYYYLIELLLCYSSPHTPEAAPYRLYHQASYASVLFKTYHNL